MPLSMDFAFEGFRIIRERPKLIPFWGLVLLIGNSLMTFLVVAIAGPAMEHMYTVVPGVDPQTLVPIYTTIAKAYGAVLPISLVTQAVISCAVYRAVWGKADDRFGYLRFGVDEVRQIAVTILYFLVYLVLVFVDCFVAGMIGGLVGAAAGQSVALLVALVGLLAVGVVMLRLSLCTVQSFDRKGIDVFGSWKLTQKQGWALFGGYVVMLVMVLFVMALCIAFYGAVTVAISGGTFATVGQWLTEPDKSSPQAFFKPYMIGWVVVSNFLVAPLIAALMSGAQAAAYRTLAGQTQDPGI